MNVWISQNNENVLIHGAEIEEWALYNNLGQLVENNQNNIVSIYSLQAGVYFLKVKPKNARTDMMFKILKH